MNNGIRDVSPNIMNHRNRASIEKFADKIQKMKEGIIHDDVVGAYIPHLTGTRTGFNFKS